MGLYALDSLKKWLLSKDYPDLFYGLRLNMDRTIKNTKRIQWNDPGIYWDSHLFMSHQDLLETSHYLDTPPGYLNHLIDKSFNSHQEYTMATYLQAPIRGTTRPCNLLIFKHFTKSCFCYPPNLVTIWSPVGTE